MIHRERVPFSELLLIRCGLVLHDWDRSQNFKDFRLNETTKDLQRDSDLHVWT